MYRNHPVKMSAYFVKCIRIFHIHFSVELMYEVYAETYELRVQNICIRTKRNPNQQFCQFLTYSTYGLRVSCVRN